MINYFVYKGETNGVYIYVVITALDVYRSSIQAAQLRVGGIWVSRHYTLDKCKCKTAINIYILALLLFKVFFFLDCYALLYSVLLYLTFSLERI